MNLDVMEKSLSKDGRISSKDAGYMELESAKKDADCREVYVKDGVSSNLGCCNKFKPRTTATEKFSCGTCRYVK